MSPKQIGPIAQAWYRWKALRLPWRRRFFIGYDLKGNTYWEFRLTRGPSNEYGADRWRRIVNYPRSAHYSSVKVSPLWHQWLRHTRQDPPSLEEQQGDVVRQARMKYLAAEADARWEAKPRVMDIPESERPKSALEDGQRHQEQQMSDGEEAQKQQAEGASTSATETQESNTRSQTAPTPETNDPWAKARAQGPSEKWQPTAWSPTAAKKR